MKLKLIEFARSEVFQPFWEKLNDWSKTGMNYWGGARWYNSGEIPAFKSVLQKFDEDYIVIFDVGTNKGNYAEALINIVTSEAKKCEYHCFEPVSSTFKLLSDNLKSNESVILNNFGMGSRKDEVKLFIPMEGSGLSSVFNEHLLTERNNYHITETVKLSTLDDYCAENDVSLIHFLKIDVEGFELDVIKGAQRLIEENKILAIQFEFGEAMIDARIFVKDFWKLLNENYKLYKILPNGLREIEKYSISLEVFHCMNFIAIHKSL